jgi:hypothetical protein
VTVDDDEEDEEDRVTGSPRPVRERPCCGSPPVCHRRPSPGPVPLVPSAIRPTCRPTSRGGGSNTPPCEKVPPLPVRQTEKPKIWSLAETALSKSPERRPQQQQHRPSHHHISTVSQHRYHPYNSLPCSSTIAPAAHHRLPGSHPHQPQQQQQHEAILAGAVRAGHFSTAPLIVQRPLLSTLQCHTDKGAALQTS